MSQTAATARLKPRNSVGRILLSFLGSMSLAVTLLIGFSVAAFIGVILQQNQPYTDYVFQLGPFWFQVFQDLGLYNIFSAPWLVAIFAFLVLSTSVCIVRTSPRLLREMWNFRLNIQAHSMRSMRLHTEQSVAFTQEDMRARVIRLLRNHGYRVREAHKGDHVLVAGMKGAINRSGYLFMHVGLVVVLLTGVIDGNLPIDLAVWQHGLKPMTQAVPISEVPKNSRLPLGTLAFRGDVTLPEGDSTNGVFFRWGKGYLEQQLPFTITLKKFAIERYPGGRPKDFVSSVIVTNPRTHQVIKGTVSDNHPMFYHGIGIYQSSFGDGGSHLKFRLWSMNTGQARVLRGQVFDSYVVQTADGPMRVKFERFKAMNIGRGFSFAGKGQSPMINLGPSVGFKVVRPDGQATEYINYMHPQLVHGRLFYLSGVRTSPAKPYSFLTIPADSHGGMQLFMRMVNALHNPKLLRQAAQETAQEVTTVASAGKNPVLQTRLAASVENMLMLFGKGGYTLVQQGVASQLSAAKRQVVDPAIIRVLNIGLENLYMLVLERDGTRQVTRQDTDWLAAALPELSVLNKYGAPFYLQLTGYRQILASGLQVTYYPLTLGAFIGAFMLVIGSILMFFVPYRRVWIRIDPNTEKGSRILFAGTSNRHQREFEREFASLGEKLVPT